MSTWCSYSDSKFPSSFLSSLPTPPSFPSSLFNILPPSFFPLSSSPSHLPSHSFYLPIIYTLFENGSDNSLITFTSKQKVDCLTFKIFITGLTFHTFFRLKEYQAKEFLLNRYKSFQYVRNE